MKRRICLLLTVTLAALSFAAPGQAYRGGWGPLVGLGIGVGLMELSHPYHYYSPPVVIEQAPSVYIQQSPQQAPMSAQEPTYWYYCQEPQGYYPYVKQCPQGWMKVVPTPPAQ